MGWTLIVAFAEGLTARPGGHACKECGDGHDQAHMAVPAMPGSRLAMIETEVVLGVQERFLDHPSQSGGGSQAANVAWAKA